MIVQETTAMAGWKLVPVEPTEEMVAAGNKILDFTRLSPETYSAMLAAAPPPATSSAVEALREAIWPIETDDQVEVLARECGINNRRYMTPKDYSIWCEQQRKFARLAALQAGTEVAVKDIAKQIAMVFQFQELGRLRKNGDFVCSGKQIDLLEALSLQAAERIAALAPVQQAGVDDPVTALSAQNDARTIHGAAPQAGVESELVERLQEITGLLGTEGYEEAAATVVEAAASLSQLQQRIAEVERELVHARKTPDQHYSDALTAAIAEDGP